MEVGIITPINIPQYNKGRIRYFVAGFLEDLEYLNQYKEACSLSKYITILDLTAGGWKRQPFTKGIVNLPTPSWYILPSETYHKEKTLEVVKKIIYEVVGVGTCPKNTIGCLEGTSIEELQECRKEMEDLDIKDFALPAHCYKFGLELEDIFIYIDNWKEPLEVPNREGSILLTSLPIRLGLQGRILSDYKPFPQAGSYFQQGEDRFPEVVKNNIEEVLKHYGD